MRKATLGEKVDTFIAYKRSLGYVYDTAERYLKHYQRHMEEHYPHLDLPDKESTDRRKCHAPLSDEIYGAQLYQAYVVLLQIRAGFLCGLQTAFLPAERPYPGGAG